MNNARVVQAIRPTPPRLPAGAFEDVRRNINLLRQEVQKVIVGKQEIIDKVILAAMAEGSHVLFEDMPGLAKSVLAATFSKAAGCDFRRIQFTPDLLPTDITGGHIFNRKTDDFEFRRGPIFTNFLLADEINRASPKTQSALLEAMAEKQVSVEGITHKLSPPFIVLATQNPVEQEGTYPLPEAQLDRFAMRLSMGYPTHAEEIEIMDRRVFRKHDSFDTKAVISRDDLMRAQAAAEEVHVDRAIMDYIARLIVLTRSHPSLVAGCSPRGSLNLLKLARARATMQGRTYVVPDDVRELAVPVLAHRTILSSDARVSGVTQVKVIEEIIRKAPVPRSKE